MAASAWSFYDQFMLEMGEALIDFTSGTYKIALFTSASNVGSNPLSPATYGNATNEVAAANGYTTGGNVVAITWANSSGTETLGSADAVWTPTGSGITARYAVLYNSTTGKLVAWTLLNTTPSDVNITRITISAFGIGTLSRAA
jgi:hypothetical protein